VESSGQTPEDSKVETSTPPLLIIGLDSATFALLAPWLETGELPCLSRLYREGVRGPLESVTPPLSPEAWATFMTGKHPGLHGVMNFLSFRPGSYDLQFTNGSLIRGKTIWRLLGEAGKRVGVMGVPMTYPPEPVNGYLVSGLETPGAGARYTYPESLADELRQAVGGYDLHGDFTDTADPGEHLTRILATVDNHARAACYLLKRYPAHLSAVVIGATDRVQHGFWRYMDPAHPWHEAGAPQHLADAIKTVYRRVDDALARIIAQLPEPRNLVVMSDHGCGPCHTLVNLNHWLVQHGYLRLKSRGGAARRAIRAAYAGAAARSPRWLKDALKSRLPGLRGKAASLMLFNEVSWPQTRAFAICTQHGYLYLNRRDRFPLGLVAPGAEAERVCASLEADLGELRHPRTGEPLVARVVRTRQLYRGPACDALPDMIVLWRDGYIARTRADVAGTSQSLLGPTGRALDEWSASHRPDGILIAHGPGFAPPGPIQGARLDDLAPTLLHLLGQPVPQDMTGRVLTQLLDPTFLAHNPVRYSAAERAEALRLRSGQAAGAPTSQLSPEESEELADRLRRMGYL
jgi:predicted AlkP superfamily phosphohydrolase/phosphomutase